MHDSSDSATQQFSGTQSASAAHVVGAGGGAGAGAEATVDADGAGAASCRFDEQDTTRTTATQATAR